MSTLKKAIGTGQRYLWLAIAAYVPLILAAPNKVAADTKQFLYLNPTDLMSRALSLWDQSVAGGAVTHQTIGYLWPMGPFYWVWEQLGVPDWFAQRLWIGSIIFVAAAGTLFLLDRVLPRHWVNVVGAVLYGFSPYVLGHVTGQSALLLPFSAFPWLVAFMGFAVLRGGWRWPAAFALVVTTAGSLNGSSVFFVVLGAVIWAPMLVFTTTEVTWKDAAGAVARAGLLTFVTQLWWIVAYQVGGAYGLPILAMTETVEVTSATTTAPEILRGLGYWFFYGSDRDGPWLSNIAPLHTTNLVFLVISFITPLVTLLLAPFVRFPQRLYFALLTLVGLTLAVGAYSASGRSPYGAAFYKLAELSPLVMSLRNTQRATPLLLLGLAGLLAAGLQALGQLQLTAGRHGRHSIKGAIKRTANFVPLRPLVAGVVLVSLAVSFPSFWLTGLVGERFYRDNEIPQHWQDTASYLDGGQGRYWELPGIDFASYRWGNTLDPVLAGLTQRDGLWRELIPSGSPAAADLVGALDRSIQDGTFQPAALAPVARLLGVENVVLRSDLEYERYRTMRPQRVWEWFKPTPLGLGDPVEFGSGYVNRAPAHLPMIDELELALDAQAETPPAVAVFTVPDVPEQVRAVPVSGGIVVAGSGDGVVAAAAAGLFNDFNGPLRYAAEVTANERLLAEAIPNRDTVLIITDSNRLRGQHWFSLKDNVGAIEVPGQPAIPNDESDARLLPVEPTSPASLSVAEFRGARNVWATGYGNPITLTPEYRAVNAFDGNFNTSWMMTHGITKDPSIIGIELEQRLSPTHILLRQETNNPGWRRIFQVEIRLDNSRQLTVNLDESSLEGQGQVVPLDGESFQTLEIEVLDAEPGSGRVGFSEISIPGVTVEEIVHLPTDLTNALGSTIYNHPLYIVLNRMWVDPSDVVRSDPEERLIRALDLDQPAAFTMVGQARLSPHALEDLIDATLGILPVEAGGATFRSSAHLASSLRARAFSAFDGDPSTAWMPVFGPQDSHWLALESASEITLEHLEMQVLADGRHSLPAMVAIDVDGQRQAVVNVPELVERNEPGFVTQLKIPLDATLVGHEFQFVFLEVDERKTTDWYSGQDIALPLGVVEISVPGLPDLSTAPHLNEVCRFDLLSLNGKPVGVTITGTTENALNGEPIDVALCEDSLTITGVEDILRSSPGRDTGFNIDQLLLYNEIQEEVDTQKIAVPLVEWKRNSPTSFDARVAPWDEPVWLVVDESWNKGWRATIDGQSLGEPQRHDLWGMGWWIEPRTTTTHVEINWTPQRAVNVALAVSGLGVLCCLGLLMVGNRRQAKAQPTKHRLASDTALDKMTLLVPQLELPSGASPWLVVVAALVLGTALVSPWWGVGLALLLAATRIMPSLIRWLGLLPGFFVGMAAAYIAVLQLRWRYPLESVWPEHFERVHQLTFAAVVLMALLALLPSRSDTNTKIDE